MASIIFAVALLASGKIDADRHPGGPDCHGSFLNLRLRPWCDASSPADCHIPRDRHGHLWGDRDSQAAHLQPGLLSCSFPSRDPLVLFTSDRKKMGNFVNPPWVKLLAWITPASSWC